MPSYTGQVGFFVDSIFALYASMPKCCLSACLIKLSRTSIKSCESCVMCPNLFCCVFVCFVCIIFQRWCWTVPGVGVVVGAGSIHCAVHWAPPPLFLLSDVKTTFKPFLPCLPVISLLTVMERQYLEWVHMEWKMLLNIMLVRWYGTMVWQLQAVLFTIMFIFTAASPLSACLLSCSFSCWADPWIRWDKRTSFSRSRTLT